MYRGNSSSGETSQYDVRRWSEESPSLSRGFDAEEGGGELLDIAVKGSRRDVSRERVGAISLGRLGNVDKLRRGEAWRDLGLRMRWSVPYRW
jgi:hypothetical protein